MAALSASLVLFATIRSPNAAPLLTRAAFKPEWLKTPHDFAFAVSTRAGVPYVAGNFGIVRGQRDCTSASRESACGWKKVADANGLAILSVAFAPDGTGVASGQMGLLLEAESDSDNWHRIDANTSRRLFSTAANADGAFVIAGELGTLLYRRKSSRQFVQVKTAWQGFAAPNLYDVTYAARDIAIAVGEYGQITTINDGTLHDSLRTGVESLYAIKRCGSFIYAVGQQGIVESRNGNAGWQASRISDRPDLYSLACIGGSRLTAAGPGALYVADTLSDRPSWRRLSSNETGAQWFSSIAVTDSDASLLVAGPGGLWKADLSDGQ